jgi:putative ABC transport system substrate-binding protein
MIGRRHLLSSVALACLCLPLVARPQENQRVYRVGVLRPGSPPTELGDAPLRVALRELGYGPGLEVETRYAHGSAQRLTALAKGLVDDKVDIVVALGVVAVRAMKQATSTMPIVMFGNFDPVALGLVDSLSRPGGNVTGVLIAPDGTLAGKRLELLREAVPQATRIALLMPAEDTINLQVEETRRAARKLGVELPLVTVHRGDYAGAFAAIARERVAALVVGSHQYLMRDRRQIIDLAAAHRLPAMYEWREQVVDGGLMTYSTSRFELYQRIAAYVDRILKGAKPAELPIERPTTFDLVINLKTAKALGLTIPQSLLLRADKVIE